MRRVAVTFALVVALALPAAAQADDVVLSQSESADPVNPGALETYNVTVRNTSGFTLSNDFTVELAGFSRNGEHAVNNPYRTVTPTQGNCSISNTPNGGGSFGYKWTDCTLGALAPGATAKIKAVVEMHESMDHTVAVLQGATNTTPIAEPTTVIAPPVLDGSKKIRLKGLPEGCASDDFKLKAKSKGKRPKKITASLERKKLKSKKGKKLKADVAVSDLEQSSLNELTVKATFFGSPQQKLIATFQRC
jgi:hypothetical protein